MIQSLMQKALGETSIVFGAGADGARELTFDGTARFPNDINLWSGYWVIQAKYKTKEDDEDDFKWIEKQFRAEMTKFIEKKLRKPTNYIFLTNAVLTPKADIGGRDKIEKVKKEYEDIIPNIFIAAYDDICRLLDNNRDVATGYSSFILSGDILVEIFKFFSRENDVIANSTQIIKTYLEKEMRSEQTSKLIQAGSLTHNVNLENVFVDLMVRESRNARFQEESFYAIKHIIDKGNSLHRGKGKQERLVFIGGAGAGKSTITQFACQVYTAYFLKNVANKNTTIVNDIIKESRSLIKVIPTCLRIPFKIVLKDYAGWISSRQLGQPVLVLSYLQYKINLETGKEIEIDILNDLLSKLSFLFVFDGLDEVPINSNRDVVIREINNFVEVELWNADCDAIVLATTRPQGYSKEFDTERYNHLYLNDMTDEICITYLNKLLKIIETSAEKRRGYIDTLRNALDNEVTGNLMRTPLQTTIMAILVIYGGEISSNKYKLFEDYYGIIFKREKQKKVSFLINEFENQIHKIHNRLAFKLQFESENNINLNSYMERNVFEDLIRDYLKEEEWSESDVLSFLEEFKRTLIHRLVFITEIQDGKVGFVIRSMQEFFAANEYMDSDDIKVIERVRNISTNAYWRNTLLFSIGNLRSRRFYLLDRVFDVCLEMNGIELEPGENNCNKILSLGSWLALDILTEGIIDDNPKLVNKFSALLKELILLPFLTDHLKFRKLQYRVKNVWVLDNFLSGADISSFSRPQHNKFFNILETFLNGNNDEIVSKSLSILKKNTYALTYDLAIHTLLNANKIDSYFYEIFFKALIVVPNHKLENIFVEILESERYEIIEYLYRNSSNKFEVAKAFAEYITLLAFNSMFDENFDQTLLLSAINLLENMEGKLSWHPERSWNLIVNCFKTAKIQLFPYAYVEYVLIDRVNIDFLNTLLKISDKYNLEFFSLYFKYLITPTKLNLRKLLDSSENIDALIRESIVI